MKLSYLAIHQGSVCGVGLLSGTKIGGPLGKIGIEVIQLSGCRWGRGAESERQGADTPVLSLTSGKATVTLTFFPPR
jgi:hypothetical protein